MLEYINIDKTLVPYQFDIKLDNITYTFDVKYNNVGDYFTIDLYKQGAILVSGEKLIYGKSLFSAYYDDTQNIIVTKSPDYPNLIIIPYDVSENETKVTYENIDKTVFLYVRSESDLNV
jgi:hypothetical protein